MALQALKIVGEEFAKVRDEADAVGHEPDHLDFSRLEQNIIHRISKECVEIPDPPGGQDSPCPWCGTRDRNHHASRCPTAGG